MNETTTTRGETNMKERHDGITEVSADWRRLESGIEGLQDLAEWLGMHPRVPHPELYTVWVWDATVALDLIDEHWTIEEAISPDRCVLICWFGPVELRVNAPSWPFGRIEETTLGKMFVPFHMRQVLRNRIALTVQAEEKEGLL